MEKKEHNPEEQVERCVLCGRETEHTFGMPIQRRKYYISGCGQLCRNCYAEIKDPEEE